MDKRKYNITTAKAAKPKTNYGKLIVDRLTEAGMSLSLVERLLGYSDGKLQKMINGKTYINPKDAEALANLLGDNTLKDKILSMQSEYYKEIFLKQFEK